MLLAQIIEKREKIKDLNNNYKGDQLGREISKLLNAGSQKENINSNYNDGEPTHQTVQEAHQQKKNTNLNPASNTTPQGQASSFVSYIRDTNLNPASSTTPQGQASSSSPRSYIKEASSSQHTASIVKQAKLI